MAFPRNNLHYKTTYFAHFIWSLFQLFEIHGINTFVENSSRYEKDFLKLFFGKVKYCCLDVHKTFKL